MTHALVTFDRLRPVPATPARTPEATSGAATTGARRDSLGRALRAWAPDLLAALGGAMVLTLASTTTTLGVVALALGWPTLLAATGASRLRAVPGTRRLQVQRVLRAAAGLGLTLWACGALAPSLLPPDHAPLVGATAAVALLSALARLAPPARRAMRLLVVGEEDQIAVALDELHRNDRDLVPVAVCALGRPTADLASGFEPGPALTFGIGLDSVHETALNSGAEAVLVLPGARVSARDVERLGWHLGPHGVEVFLSTGLLDVCTTRTAIAEVNGLRLVHLRSLPSAGPARMVKGATERAATLLVVLALAPILFTIALAIRLDSRGPALFAQRRVGRHGREFTMYKFRTMHPDADLHLAALSELNEGAGVLFKLRRDPRVTRLGSFLRRYSLDELPQLLNVLRGDMSLVGPRPALPCEVERYDADTRRRLAVHPGLTGLWQVSGRSDLPWSEAVRLDLRYVDNWSLGLDLGILCRTVGAVLSRRGAY